jgi:hypothetical protein
LAQTSNKESTMPGIRDFVFTQAASLADGPIKAGITRAMTAYDSFAAERAKIENDPNLSGAGKRQKVQEFLKANVHEVVRVQKLTEKTKAKQAEKRKKLAPPAIDKTDAAGAMLRAQVRTKLESMSRGERKAFLASATDPLYLAAVLEAPNELSGVDAETREMVLAKSIEIAHPGALAALERDNLAVQMLDVAARVLTEHAAEIAGLPNVRALDDLINTAIPDQRHLEADAERIASAIAA